MLKKKYKSASTMCLDTDKCQIRKVNADEYTPITLVRATKAVGLLESVNSNTGRSRYSFILVKESFRLLQDDGKIFIEKNNTKSIYCEDLEKKAVLLDLLRGFADQHDEMGVLNKLGIPFPAGGIGYLSFEYAKYCDSFSFEKQKNTLKQAEALFLIPHTFIVFDHVEEILYLVALQYQLPKSIEQKLKLDIKTSNLHTSLNHLERMMKGAFKKKQTFVSDKHMSEIVNEKNEAQAYCDMVKKIKDRIVDGYLLQAVPSRRVKVKSSLTPEQAYRLLRHHNPAPYMFFLNFGDHHLLGSSPESHVKTVEGKAIVTPIAGTRRRGENIAEDMQLAQELLEDEKEKAEHIMLVDLARNDLSRVCVSESIEVREFFKVKYFAKVMHIVSEVFGILRSDKDDGKQNIQKSASGLDALKATFPAGTVSGAPKIQAVYEISKIEKEMRGFYAGVVGYVMPKGDVDTCITLRSMLYKDGYFYLQSGAGIVYDSIPEREFAETQEKISALAKTLGV